MQDWLRIFGIPHENIFIPDIGVPLEITHNTASLGEAVPSGSIMVDGAGVGDVGNIVLKDRHILSQDGLMVVAVALDKDTGEILSGPEMFSRGFVYVRESEELMESSKEFVGETRLSLR